MRLLQIAWDQEKVQLNVTWDIEWDFRPRKVGHSGKTGEIRVRSSINGLCQW